MDKETRNRIQRATQQARSLLEADYEKQLGGTYDILLAGEVKEAPGAHLDPWQLPIREKLVAAVEHLRAGGLKPAEAVAAYLREAAFTTLNRFVALKMLEARGLVQEAVSRGEQSSGFREFTGLAPGLVGLPDHGYRLYLESLFDEIGQEVKVLFDRSDPASLLWPGHQAFLDLLALLNQPDLASVWGEDETIGWVYQYFNSDDERKKMRSESRAPRNGREMAVRNQFFTPRYVVEFLTDNTLGRTWYEMRQGDTVLVDRCQYLVRRHRPVFLSPREGRPTPFQASGGDVSAPAASVAAMWTRPNPDQEASRDIHAYAMTVDGYRWSEEAFDRKCEELFLEKEKGYRETRIWQGSFEELRCALFFMLRSQDRWGAPDPDEWPLEEIRSLHQAVCRRWELETEHICFRAKKDPRDLKILDPACGSGHFLLYCFDLLTSIYEEAWTDEQSPVSEATGRTLAQDYGSLDAVRAAIPGLVLKHNLYGIDIDPRAIQIAALTLWMRAQRAFRDFGLSRQDRTRIHRTNMVLAAPMPGEQDLQQRVIDSLEDPRLGAVMTTIFSRLQDAGEAGPLVLIEEQIREKVKEAYGRSGPIFSAEDRERWESAEGDFQSVLSEFGKSSGLLKMFAEDATQGLALIQALRHRYDVVLMNPPFGSPSKGTKKLLEGCYPSSKGDILATFLDRAKRLLIEQGFVGAITSRAPFFLGSFRDFRTEVIQKGGRLALFADLGDGVLDAMVETCALVYRRSEKDSSGTVFHRLLLDEMKDAALRVAVGTLREGNDSQNTFVHSMDVFSKVRNTPFSYWAPPAALAKIGRHERIEGGVANVRVGLQTGDDFRFLRTVWEVPPGAIAPSPSISLEGSSELRSRCLQELSRRGGALWCFYSKTDRAIPWHSPLGLVVKWAKNGREIKNFCDKNGKPRSAARSEKLYFQPGFSYMLRSSRLVPYVVPAGVIPTAGRAQVFPETGQEELVLAYCASNLASAIARFSGEKFAWPKFQASMVQELPWSASLSEASALLREVVTREWQARKAAARFQEPHLEFTAPGEFSAADAPDIDDRLTSLLGEELDAAVARCFNLSMVEQEQVERDLQEALSLRASAGTADEEDETSDEDGEAADVPLVAAADSAVSPMSRIVSYLLGVAFGRWDVRRESIGLAGPVADVYERLPCVPVGSLVSPEGLFAESGRIVSLAWLMSRRSQVPVGPLTEQAALDDGSYPVDVAWTGVLSDDAGSEADAPTRLRAVLELIGSPASVAELDLRDEVLREFLAFEFFPVHLHQYTYGGRRAPIYWHIGVPSARYSIWLYYLRLSRDSLYLVLNDTVLKAKHEEARLTKLIQEAGSSPTSHQRGDIDKQQTFVEELRAFREEIELAAPLWNPNLNDGVLINFAPLWRLVPHHREWQKECRDCWNDLAAGKYDWAHLAMHLWPERVVPRCADDRSLAIAHDLEQVFWEEGADGKWRKKHVLPETVAALVQERSSRTVRDARDRLLAAPEPVVRRGGRRTSAPRAPRVRIQRSESNVASVAAATPTRRTSRSSAQPEDLDAVRRFLASSRSGASKGEILTATGLPESTWKVVIEELLANGEVVRTGEKRGTKYHLANPRPGDGQ